MFYCLYSNFSKWGGGGGGGGGGQAAGVSKPPSLVLHSCRKQPYSYNLRHVSHNKKTDNRKKIVCYIIFRLYTTDSPEVYEGHPKS